MSDGSPLTELELRRDFKEATQELVVLNRELASQLILLSSQTGDPTPLIAAVNTLRSGPEKLRLGKYAARECGNPAILGPTRS